MALQLYINGHLITLEPGQVIAQTKQVNDLNSLDNRQTNYTNKFKIPKTASNVMAFRFLSFTGNNSNTPYAKNECSLYSESGECFVYKGWAIITDAGDSYDAVIYDGIIDLYKRIENKNLPQLNLAQDLNHKKNTASVMAAMHKTHFNPDDARYTYILTDYNGKATFNNNPNIDYIVPAVNVKYLWNKIFTEHNMQVPMGSVFDTEDFKNLWMTFPKGIDVSTYSTIFKSNSYSFTEFIPNFLYRARFNSASVNNLVYAAQNQHLKVAATGAYRLSIKGIINAYKSSSYGSDSAGFTILLGKNGTPNHIGTFIGPIGDAQTGGQEFEVTSQENINLGAHDSVCIYIMRNSDGGFYISPHIDASLEVLLTKADAPQISFADNLSDFSVRDFMSEVVHRFGLTIFKDKYTGQYTFLTLQEQLQGRTLDWSRKFIRKTSEKYVYGSYARTNHFRYNYNDKESTYHDGSIDIGNENLQDSRDVIKSKIYSPEKDTVPYLNQYHYMYKLWDKQVKDDGTVEYKPLDKRYYFLRKETRLGPNIRLVSEKLNTYTDTVIYNTESYHKLPFNEILSDYYRHMGQIVSSSVIINADLYLTEADIAGFDFRKLIYIEQESAYFLMNKINNYIPGKPVKCEMVKLTGSSVASKLTLQITRIEIKDRYIKVYYLANIPLQNLTVQVLEQNHTEWQNALGGPSPAEGTMPEGTLQLRLYDQHNNQQYFSQPVTINVPSEQTIYL